MYSTYEQHGIISWAGPLAQERLDPEQQNSRWGTAVHESGHAVVGMHFNRVPWRVVVFADGGGRCEFSPTPIVGPNDLELLQIIAEMALPDGDAQARATWNREAYCAAYDLVRKLEFRILGFAKLLEEHGGELGRADIEAYHDRWRADVEAAQAIRERYAAMQDQQNNKAE